MPFYDSLHLDGLPFASTRRPEAPSIQRISYPLQRLNAGTSNLEDDGLNI
jgi:hypothetical protein